MYIIQVCERLERLNTRGKCLTLKLMLRAENAPEQTAKFLGKDQLSLLFLNRLISVWRQEGTSTHSSQKN